MTKLLQGEDLEKRCIELGVNIEGPPRTQSSSGSSPRASDFELHTAFSKLNVRCASLGFGCLLLCLL